MAAGDTVITIVGNLVDDPELRFTPTGHAVVNFRIASTPRFLDNAASQMRVRLPGAELHRRLRSFRLPRDGGRR